MLKCGMGEVNSPSSSIDSSSHPCISSSSVSQTRGDLSTDLRLGPSISTSLLWQANSSFCASKAQPSNWPPIKPLLKSTLSSNGRGQTPTSLFVKVYMEGIPIGRKLDLYAHKDYNALIRTLCLMFRTTIVLTRKLAAVSTSRKAHVLTYEDKEGDWMMVGDVPWGLFLTTVKRLKIARADRS